MHRCAPDLELWAWSKYHLPSQNSAFQRELLGFSMRARISRGKPTAFKSTTHEQRNAVGA